MAILLQNTFEGGVAGNSVSPGDLGSGNPFDIGTAGVLYDTTHPGPTTTQGMKIVTAATVVAAYVGWNTSLGTLTTNQTMHVRFYYYAPGTPTSSVRMLQILNGSTVLAGINHASGTGNLGLRITGDVGTGTVEATPAIPANTLVRVEATFTGLGTTTGSATAHWYTGDSLTPGDTTAASITSLSFGTLAPNTVRLGINTANASVSSNYWWDDWAISLDAAIGPYVGGPPGPIMHYYQQARMLPSRHYL